MGIKAMVIDVIAQGEAKIEKKLIYSELSNDHKAVYDNFVSKVSQGYANVEIQNSPNIVYVTVVTDTPITEQSTLQLDYNSNFSNEAKASLSNLLIIANS